MTLPQITATGTLVSDPELRWTKDGTPLLNCRIACNERKRDQNGNWIDGRATFLSFSVFRQAAEQAAGELAKGQEVTIIGLLVEDEWIDKDGQERKTMKVDVSTIARTYGRRKDLNSPAPRSAPVLDDEEPF